MIAWAPGEEEKRGGSGGLGLEGRWVAGDAGRSEVGLVGLPGPDTIWSAIRLS